jgi:putative flippase GtrA
MTKWAPVWSLILKCGAAFGWPPARTARIFRFALVGGLSSGVYALVTFAATKVVGLRIEIANVLGYLVGIPMNFILHRQVTFMSSGRLTQELPRFVATHACNLLASTAIVYILVEVAGLPVLIGIAAVVVAIPAAQYLLLEAWVFHSHDDAEGKRRLDRGAMPVERCHTREPDA